MNKWIRNCFAWTLLLGFTASALYAEDKKDDKKPAADAAKKDEKKPADPAKKDAPPAADKKPAGDAAKDAKGAMPPGMEAMMAGMMPGPEHAKLKALEGSWNCTYKMMWDPSGPKEDKGTLERKWIMGGRFLMETVKSPPMMPGMPEFEGMALIGYDNTQKKFVMKWIDNMGTGFMDLVGTFDAAGKVMTCDAEMWDPMTGKPSKQKHVLTIKDDKSHSIQMFGPGPDGKEMLHFDMTCTKK